MAEKLGKKAKIHIKVDTGMSRIGFSADEAGLAEAVKILDLPGIEQKEYSRILQKLMRYDKTPAIDRERR